MGEAYLVMPIPEELTKPLLTKEMLNQSISQTSVFTFPFDVKQVVVTVNTQPYSSSGTSSSLQSISAANGFSNNTVHYCFQGEKILIATGRGTWINSTGYTTSNFFMIIGSNTISFSKEFTSGGSGGTIWAEPNLAGVFSFTAYSRKI